MPRPVALDHNFPEPILDCVRPWLPEVELAWVRAIGPGLGDVEDHELLYALREHGYPVLVTNNWKMENDARVLVALERTRMSLLTLKKAGDDAIFATGVLLRDLIPLLSTEVPRGQVFVPRRAASSPDGLSHSSNASPSSKAPAPSSCCRISPRSDRPSGASRSRGGCFRRRSGRGLLAALTVVGRAVDELHEPLGGSGCMPGMTWA